MKRMKNKTTPLVDEYLQSLAGMKEVQTDDFFYTRLRARMENRQSGPAQREWAFRLKPIWVIGGLVVLLVMNGVMLLQSGKKEQSTASSSTPIQKFAASFDQTIAFSY